MNNTITTRMMTITLVIIITTEITTTLAITPEDATVLTVIAEIIPMKLIFITFITATTRVQAIIITVQKATIWSIIV